MAKLEYGDFQPLYIDGKRDAKRRYVSPRTGKIITRYQFEKGAHGGYTPRERSILKDKSGRGLLRQYQRTLFERGVASTEKQVLHSEEFRKVYRREIVKREAGDREMRLDLYAEGTIPKENGSRMLFSRDSFAAKQGKTWSQLSIKEQNRFWKSYEKLVYRDNLILRDEFDANYADQFEFSYEDYERFDLGETP